MNLKELNLETLQSDFVNQSTKVKNSTDLELLKRDWIGKDGLLKNFFKGMGSLSPEERPKIAASLNVIKEQVESFLKSKSEEFELSKLQTAIASETIDLTLPEKSPGVGRSHPLTQIEKRIISLLRPFGFKVVYGPEVETDYYCFDSLNIPKHHPARDMQDTFYTTAGHVLRTHTTSVQARILKQGGFPIKVLSLGRCYRNEAEDASHGAMFHQFELFWVDKGLTLSNLMAIMSHIVKGLYGKRTKIRFKPKFYPYVEPGLGLDVACSVCGGKGCATCGYAGWATLVGAGMIHSNVLKEFGYDPSEVSGMAFGFGSSRLAQQDFKIANVRQLYQNDLRILRQV